MLNKQFLKIISIVLIIFVIYLSPLGSYIQVNNAYASITLTAAALTILKYVIPIVASYVCLNVIGKSYTNSDLQKIITQLNKSQEAIWQLISAYGKLTLYKVISNIKNIGKNIAECASELLITDNKTIENATTYSDSLTNKVQANENLTPNDIVDLGIGRALTYSIAKMATDTTFLNTKEIDINNSVTLGEYTVAFEKTSPTKSFLSSFTDTVGYLNVNTNLDFQHQGYSKLSYDYYFTNNGYKYIMRVISDYQIVAINNNVNVTLERWIDCLSANFPDSDMKIDFYYFDNATMTYERATTAALKVGDILGEVGLSTFKTRLTNSIEYYDKTAGGKVYKKIQDALNTLDTTNTTLWDLLNISLYGEYTINPSFERPIPTTIPLYPTKGICNDDIWDIVNPTTSRPTMTADTNITVNTDGSISANTTNPKLDGVPLTDLPNVSIPNVDSPAIPDNPAIPNNPDGEVIDGTISWFLKIPILGSILKAIQDLWEWLKTLPELFKTMLLSLFVPSSGFFTNYFTKVQFFLTDRFGLLFYPFTLLLDLANKYLNMSSTENLVIQMRTPFSIPVGGQEYVIVPAFKFDFAELYSRNGFKEMRNLILIITDVLISVGLINLIQRKFKEVVEK